jgi:hypothetical protein
MEFMNNHGINAGKKDDKTLYRKSVICNMPNAAYSDRLNDAA